MVRRRAAMTEGETSEKKAGSSLYSRHTTIHMETEWRRITVGSTRSSRAFSHSWRILSCSRIEGSRGGMGAAGAAPRVAAANTAASPMIFGFMRGSP